MAIDFARVRTRELRLSDLVIGFSPEDLARATEESIARIGEILTGAADQDVTFVPEDPDANDPAAADPSELTLAWTLGHLVAHVTASAEESAALAADLARGVPFHGRSRWEVPWRTITTVDQCRRRLEDSRRMRFASLQMWPAVPPSEVDDNPEIPTWTLAKERFARGLAHEDAHVEQIQGVLQQARAARNGSPRA